MQAEVTETLKEPSNSNSQPGSSPRATGNAGKGRDSARGSPDIRATVASTKAQAPGEAYGEHKIRKGSITLTTRLLKMKPLTPNLENRKTGGQKDKYKKKKSPAQDQLETPNRTRQESHKREGNTSSAFKDPTQAQAEGNRH